MITVRVSLCTFLDFKTGDDSIPHLQNHGSSRATAIALIGEQVSLLLKHKGGRVVAALLRQGDFPGTAFPVADGALTFTSTFLVPPLPPKN